ncbi:MAG TPA: flagellar basal body-associated FliL family protein [Calidithermus sp.]|nr:flagellar basal body-associated FliL family protein [Calidithermus sp.]
MTTVTAPTAPPPAAPRRRGRQIVALGVLAVLTAGAGAAGAWFWRQREPAAAAAARESDAYWSTRSLVVNVTGRRFLRATVEFGVNRKDLAHLDERRAAVLDAVLGALGALSADVLVDPAQRDAIRQALADRVNAALGAPVVRQVYFTEFVLQ